MSDLLLFGIHISKWAAVFVRKYCYYFSCLISFVYNYLVSKLKSLYTGFQAINSFFLDSYEMKYKTSALFYQNWAYHCLNLDSLDWSWLPWLANRWYPCLNNQGNPIILPNHGSNICCYALSWSADFSLRNLLAVRFLYCICKYIIFMEQTCYKIRK